MLITYFSCISLTKQQIPSQSHKSLKGLKNKEIRQKTHKTACAQKDVLKRAKLKNVISPTLSTQDRAIVSHSCSSSYFGWFSIVPTKRTELGCIRDLYTSLV